MTQSIQSIKKSYTKRVTLNYLQYLPPGYANDSQRRWPLILFLHGGGERGTKIELVKKHGIPRLTEAGDMPFCAIDWSVCPQASHFGVIVSPLSGG